MRMSSTFWLIENTRFRSPAFYSKNECYRWTPFSDDVVRYDSERDAQDALRELPEKQDCIVTDHSVIEVE